jgi:hypothetical protein
MPLLKQIVHDSFRGFPALSKCRSTAARPALFQARASKRESIELFLSPQQRNVNVKGEKKPSSDLFLPTPCSILILVLFDTLSCFGTALRFSTSQ